MIGHILIIDNEMFEFCASCFNVMRENDIDAGESDYSIEVYEVQPTDDIECARCGEITFGKEPQDEEPADSGDPMCSHCNGTGMPMFGPPDVGSCSSCGGSGVDRSYEPDDFYDEDPHECDAYDEEREIRRAEAAYERRIYGP